jgi:hypothetical protein
VWAGGVGWLDNDPHFWEPPPTWGICRTDSRRVVKVGDYIFFVLPKASGSSWVSRDFEQSIWDAEKVGFRDNRAQRQKNGGGGGQATAGVATALKLANSVFHKRRRGVSGLGRCEKTGLARCSGALWAPNAMILKTRRS